MKSFKRIIVCIFMLTSIHAVCQTKELTGTITDPQGNPVSGASVKVKGAKIGTSADTKGSFSLRVPQNARILVSAVGFENQEIGVGDAQNLRIALKQANVALTEVVVTALGQTSSKAKL
jgi:hypothetical protein